MTPAAKGAGMAAANAIIHKAKNRIFM